LYYANYLTICSILMNGLHCPQEVRSVIGELCLIKTELLKAVDCFPHNDFPSLFTIHDLCYRLLEKGKKNIYTPYSSVDWKADAQRFNLKTEEQAMQEEKDRFQRKWHDLLYQGDPFFNTGIISDSNQSPEEHRIWLTTPQLRG